MKILDVIRYSLFPRRCELCAEVVEPNESRCEQCRSVEIIKGEICKACGSETKNCSCPKNARKPEYRCVTAPYYFENSIAKAIVKMKNYGYTELVYPMADAMLSVINDRYKDISFDFVTFVPLTRARELKRGYNQSQLLAQAVADGLGIPCVPALKKIYNTKSQRRSRAGSRMVNLHGAFDLNVDYSMIDDKTVLLIDDVKTTGSTLHECAFVLNGYGARAVYASTVAVTKRKSKKKSPTD